MGHTKLSKAEEAGWRRFWDGWIICPPCQAKHVKTKPSEWPVPATYDDPIPDTARCSTCRAEVAHLESNKP